MSICSLYHIFYVGISDIACNEFTKRSTSAPAGGGGPVHSPGREPLEAPQVSDAKFNAVRARYEEQGLLELTAVMSVYTMNAAILRVMDHQAAADARHVTPR